MSDHIPISSQNRISRTAQSTASDRLRFPRIFADQPFARAREKIGHARPRDGLVLAHGEKQSPKQL